jgi:hypothetical protein
MGELILFRPSAQPLMAATGPGWKRAKQKEPLPGAALVAPVLPDLPVERWKLGPNGRAAASHFFCLSKIIVRRLHEHSLRRRINGRSRPCIEIVRRFPKFIDDSHVPL